MKKKYMILVTGLSLMLTACGSSGDYAKSAPSEVAYEESMAVTNDFVEMASESEDIVHNEYEKKLVYTCDLTMETLNYDDTLASIKETIDHLGGFTESESSYVRNKGAEETRYCSLRVRVPSAKYNQFLQDISSVGSVTNKNSYVENVTQQYYDTETRIKALKIQEDRLLEMMAECDNVSDMIIVEQRLTEVQTELARYQTNLNVMQQEVDYSTVNIDIDEVARITVHEDSVWEKFTSVAGESWAFFTEVLSKLGVAIMYLLPFSVLAGMILFVIHVIDKQLKKKKEKKKVEERQKE